jgi:hypothetical protein
MVGGSRRLGCKQVHFVDGGVVEGRRWKYTSHFWPKVNRAIVFVQDCKKLIEFLARPVFNYTYRI